MKKTIFAIACAAGLLLMAPGQASAQADIEIGKTTIRLQSPVKISGQDKNVYRYDDDGTRKKKNRGYEDASVFFGFSFPVEGCSYEPTAAMPVKYGNSFEITLGAKQWFGIGHYAFGISAQYTHYDYRGSGLAARGIITQYPHNAVISREIFKTDNIGIGVYNRFYISLRTPLYIDLGAWGDWAFSRQYKVKYYIGDYKEVDHYRDGEKFLPLQGGVYAAVGVNLFSIYCKYRFTHWFSHSVLPMEPPRLQIGLMIEI